MTHFFKIIFSTEPKLRIPHTFVRKHESSLPSKVSLEAPYGPSWKIELFRFEGEIWMDKGFEQFMEYYSIRLGYLLIFRYCYEDLCFRVMIYDTSACEIDYPVPNLEENISKLLSSECCPRKEQNEVVVNAAELLLDDDGVGRREKVGNVKRVEEDDCTDVLIEIFEFPTKEIVEGAGKKNEGSGEFLCQCRTDKKTRRANEVVKLQIEEKRTAKKTRRANEVEKLHVEEKRTAKKTRRANEVENLQVEEKRTAKKTRQANEVEKSQIGEKMTAKKRKRANEVEKLQMEEKRTATKEVASQNRQSERIRSITVKCGTSETDVFPSRAKEKTKYDCSANRNQLSYSEKRAYERARAFVTKNPSFIVVMRHSHIIGYLNINKAFAKDFFKEEDTRDVVLRVPGLATKWLGTCHYGKWNTRIQWRQFVKDNELFQGDVCVFEQGNGARLSLNVIIFRKSKY